MEEPMKRLLLAVTVFTFLGTAIPALAHEGHGARIGEVVAVTDDTVQVKTAKETVTVKLTDKTVYELAKKAVTRNDLKKGDRVAVTAVKSDAGDLVATKVVLGLAAPKPKTTE
jgi:hypothetical protein